MIVLEKYVSVSCDNRKTGKKVCEGMKKFNVTGTCIPEKNYMVDVSGKIQQIIQMIEDDEYFTINRARQYGKTTTLSLVHQRLKERYLVLRLSFEGVGSQTFGDDESFVRFFVRKVAEFMELLGEPAELVLEWKQFGDYSEGEDAFDYLSDKITGLCRQSKKEIIVMIDEVDKSADNQIFLNFLGMLRNKYLKKREGFDVTFKSVILAGVYDVKNLKLKMRPDDEKKYNSPWNIAADFNVDMSFSPEEIGTMLQEYEQEHHTGMDIETISHELYFYTSGYPFLVSRLCKWIDEDGGGIWTIENIQNAEKALLKTRNTLFDDLIKNIENHAELKKLIVQILYYGAAQSFQLSNPVIELGTMLGIFCEKNHMVAISNVIFETYLYDYTTSIKNMESSINSMERSQFIEDGRLNMPYVLTKFQELMKAEYRQEDEKFLEQQGRLLFLCFLKPIINGKGFYYVEPETRNSTRMDIVVVYSGEEFIVELKLWHGVQYRERGIRQLEEYMDSRNVQKGYLVSFSFLKNKTYKNGWITEDEAEKQIFEIVV